MKEEMKGERPHISKAEAHRARLSKLTALSKEFIALGEEAFVRRHEKLPEDAENRERSEHITLLLREAMPFIRDALNNDVTTETALELCHTLIATFPFELLIAERIADTAHALKKQLDRHSPHTERIIQLMTESYMALCTNKGFREKTPPSAIKIRYALEGAAPHLQLYFSEANEPGATEIKNRMHALQNILMVCDEAKTVWAVRLFADHIVRLVRSKEYVPQYSARTSISLLFDAHVRGVSDAQKIFQNLKHAVTRFDIEIMLEALERDQVLAIIRECLQKIGLPSDMYETFSDQPRTRTELLASDGFELIFDQFEAMQSLELERPGSVKELYARYGLRWFTRYPIGLLIKQYDERDSVEKPYGIFVTGLVDWNKAFFSENDRGVIERIARQLNDLGYTIRCVECGGRNEMTDRFGMLDTAYGTQQKISFMFIRAHASREHMELGHDPADGDLEAKHLADPNFMRSLNMFVETPVIIFDGCSVGRRGGIAEKMSAAFSATVFAPKGVEAALVDVKVVSRDGNIVFAPRYETTAKSGEMPHVYMNGRKR